MALRKKGVLSGHQLARLGHEQLEQLLLAERGEILDTADLAPQHVLKVDLATKRYSRDTGDFLPFPVLWRS